jgi:hypothetical protein
MLDGVVRKILTSETSVNFYDTTRRNILEDSHLHTRRRENLISHVMRYVFLDVKHHFYILSERVLSFKGLKLYYELQRESHDQVDSDDSRDI